LWFKASRDYSRYGLPLAADGRAIVEAVRRAIDSNYNDADAERIKRIISIWAGDRRIEASPESIHDVIAHLTLFDRTPALDGFLVLEAFGALLDDIDNLDVDTLEKLVEQMESLQNWLDDGRPSTAVYSAWLASWRKDGEHLQLRYDPSHAFGSAIYSELNAESLKPLLIGTLRAMSQGGHPLFATGPLPLRGTMFDRDGTLSDALQKQAPEAADLFRLLALDGDYSDSHGPFSPQWYWTGDHVPDALSIREAIDNAHERGDPALCDILISYWMLTCLLFEQAPLPDLFGLAQRINALPTDHRSSTHGVLGILKREAAVNSRLVRDIDALLSWLPVVDIAPPEDIEAFLQGLFSNRLWTSLSHDEQKRLIEAEELFVRLRRLSHYERERERFRTLVVDWSAVAEPILRRVRDGLDRTVRFASDQPLGVLISEVRREFMASSKDWSREERPRMYMARNALNVLDTLNSLNTQGGKHLGGLTVAWEDVVYVHAGLYWALRALLDVATPLT
jgi:hypothetical protein